jgi:hypothetical protein
MDSAEKRDPITLESIDVTTLPLNFLISTDDTEVRKLVGQRVNEVENANEVLSAFDNFAGNPPEFPEPPSLSLR